MQPLYATRSVADKSDSFAGWRREKRVESESNQSEPAFNKLTALAPTKPNATRSSSELQATSQQQRLIKCKANIGHNMKHRLALCLALGVAGAIHLLPQSAGQLGVVAATRPTADSSFGYQSAQTGAEQLPLPLALPLSLGQQSNQPRRVWAPMDVGQLWSVQRLRRSVRAALNQAEPQTGPNQVDYLNQLPVSKQTTRPGPRLGPRARARAHKAIERLADLESLFCTTDAFSQSHSTFHSILLPNNGFWLRVTKPTGCRLHNTSTNALISLTNWLCGLFATSCAPLARDYASKR